jgi:ribonuclease Y
MNGTPLIILFSVLAAIVGFIAAWLILRRVGGTKISSAEESARRIVSEAEKEAEIKKKEALLEAKEEWYKVKSNFEREFQNRRNEIQKTEKRLLEKESGIDKRNEALGRREKDVQFRERTIGGREKGITLREQELEKALQAQNEKLEKIAQMTADEAKRELKENLIGEAKIEAAAMVKEIKETAERNAEKEAREVIISAIYRCAAWVLPVPGGP